MTCQAEKIRKRLDKQEELEGPSEDLKLVRRAFACCQTDRDWTAMVEVRFRRYGTESHRFHAPSELLRSLLQEFQGDNQK